MQSGDVLQQRILHWDLLRLILCSTCVACRVPDAKAGQPSRPGVGHREASTAAAAVAPAAVSAAKRPSRPTAHQAGGQPAATHNWSARPEASTARAVAPAVSLLEGPQYPHAHAVSVAGTQPPATSRTRSGHAIASSEPATSSHVRATALTTALPGAPKVSHAKAAVAAGFQKLSHASSSRVPEPHARTAMISGPPMRPAGGSQRQIADAGRAGSGNKPSGQGMLHGGLGRHRFL